MQTDDRLGGNLIFSRGDIAALGDGLRISNPTFTGTTRGEDSFRFTAELVEPDAAPPERAKITTLAGEIALHNGPAVDVDAATGDLDIPTQRLDLTGQVRIETSDGYQIRAEKVTLDLRAGSLVAGDAVESTGPLGRIDSAACGWRRRRRPARRAASLSETASGWYTIRRTPNRGGSRCGRAGWRGGLSCGVAGAGPGAGGRGALRRAKHDATQPVEITADRLDLDQAAGSAVFTGTVKVGQGTLRLAADRVEVFYADSAASGTGRVQRMVANGNVTLTNGTEAAEAEHAVLRGRGRPDRHGRQRAADPGAERALEPDAAHRPQRGHGPARGPGADDLRARRRADDPAPRPAGDRGRSPGSPSRTSPRATRAGRCCATCR